MVGAVAINLRSLPEMINAQTSTNFQLPFVNYTFSNGQYLSSTPAIRPIGRLRKNGVAGSSLLVEDTENHIPWRKPASQHQDSRYFIILQNRIMRQTGAFNFGLKFCFLIATGGNYFAFLRMPSKISSK